MTKFNSWREIAKPKPKKRKHKQVKQPTKPKPRRQFPTTSSVLLKLLKLSTISISMVKPTPPPPKPPTPPPPRPPAPKLTKKQAGPCSSCINYLFQKCPGQKPPCDCDFDDGVNNDNESPVLDPLELVHRFREEIKGRQEAMMERKKPAHHGMSRDELAALIGGDAARLGLLNCPHGSPNCTNSACRLAYLDAMGLSFEVEQIKIDKFGKRHLLRRDSNVPHGILDITLDDLNSEESRSLVAADTIVGNPETAKFLEDRFEYLSADRAEFSAEFPGYMDPEWKYDENNLTRTYLSPDAKLPLCVDDGTANGLIQLLQKDLLTWSTPCVIRLSDILRKMPAFLDRRPQIEYNVYQELTKDEPARPALRQYYEYPENHVDGPKCMCKSCSACEETADLLEKINFTGTYLAESIVRTICDRTRDLLISHVKLMYQEIYTDLDMDERLCYGFQQALPAVCCVDFECMFREMYKVGSHVVWEITKKLATFIKYSETYNNCLNFILFFIDVSYRMAEVIGRISKQMDFFQWKLKLHKIDLKIMFAHIFDSHLYISHEFQEIMAMCCKIVFTHRRHKVYNSALEMSTVDIKRCLDQISSKARHSRQKWKDRKEFLFKFEEYKPFPHNIFKIAPLRNPFEKVKSNQAFGYEMLLSRKSGQMEYQNLTGKVIKRVSQQDPLLDFVISNPLEKDEKFAIKLYREPSKVNIEEMEDMLNNKDAVFIKAHEGYNVILTSDHSNYYRNIYLPQRKHYNLDEAEGGPVPPQVEEALAEHTNNLSKYSFFEANKLGKVNGVKPKPHPGLKRRRVDRLWPPRTVVKTRRQSKVLDKRIRHRLIKMARKSGCPLGLTCPKSVRLRYKRFDYAFGGVPEEVESPEVRLSETKSFTFMEELIAAALQTGMSCLKPEWTFPGFRTKYFVVCTHFSMKRDDTPKYSFIPHMDDAVEMLRLHYDVLAKHNLLSVNDINHSPHLQERKWAAQVNQKENFNERIQARVQSIIHAKDKRTFPPGGKYIVPEHIEKTLSEPDRRIDEDSLMNIKNKRLVGYARRTVGDGTVETRTAFACHSTSTDCGNTTGRHANEHSLSHAKCHPPGSVCSNAPVSQNSKPGKCGDHEKKSTRPGLPVSAGYTERRNTMRQRLAREKKEREEMAVSNNHSNEPFNVHGGVTRKNIIKQEDSVPEDLDAVVQKINDVKNVSILQQHRNSSASESNDGKKAAKKARKRERKEQKKQEQDVEKELELSLTNVAEIGNGQELECSKLEKKKGIEEKGSTRTTVVETNTKKAEVQKDEKRIERKKNEEKRTNGKKIDEKKNGKKAEEKRSEGKNTEESKMDSNKAEERHVDSKMLEDVKSDTNKSTEKRSDENPKSDMVTIRRHATAPDTTVTISVKSDNGEEDVLYTLVNGQVVKAESKKPEVKSNGSHQASSKQQGAKNSSSDKKENNTRAISQKQEDKVQLRTMNKTDHSKEVVNQTSKKKTVVAADQSYARSNRSPVLTGSKTTSAPEASKPSDPMKKEFFMLRDEKGNDVDITQVKLPPGITVTKINTTGQKVAPKGAGSVLVVEPTNSTGVKSQGIHKEGPGRGFDETEDYYFTSRDSGAFEEVISNKARRQRNRENKGREGNELDEQQETQPIGKRKNSEHGISVEVCEPISKNPSSQSTRGKRSFEGHLGGADSLAFENPRHRKTSGSGGNARSQNPSQGKHGSAKSHNQKHNQQQNYSVSSNPPVSLLSLSQQNSLPPAQSLSYTGAFNPYSQTNQTSPGQNQHVFNDQPKLQNGRSTKLAHASVNNIPRLNRTIECPVVNDFNRVTISPVARHASSFVAPTLSSSNTEYFQPFKAPTPPDDPKPTGFPNGQQTATANFGVERTGDFQEYSPWGTQFGHTTDFLGNLLKELNVREGYEAQSSQFELGVNSQLPSDNMKPWNYSGINPQTSTIDPAFQGMNMFPPDVGSPSPIGSNRPQSCDLGYHRGLFGDNSSTSTSVAIQRPSPSPCLGTMRPQFTPSQAAFKYYDTTPFERQASNESTTNTAQHYTRPSDAEYSLF